MKILLILLATGALLLFLTYVIVYPGKGTLIKMERPVHVSLPYEKEWNYRQSINACGPYSAAAVIRSVFKSEISSEDVSQKTPWRYQGGTLPLGMVSVLKKYNVFVDEYIVDLSDQEKGTWLRTELAQNKPIILLGRKAGLLHYVTLFGYEKDAFFVYDSFEDKGEPGMTLDHNGEAPGNVTWTDDRLVRFWNMGGVLGLYKNYAIVPRSNTGEL